MINISSIFGSRTSQKTAPKKKKEGSFFVGDSEETPSSSNSVEGKPSSAMISGTSLFCLQNVDKQHEQEVVQYSDTLLDGLQCLQKDILQGQLSVEALQDLKNQLSKTQHGVTDQRLHQILNDINVRVSVELAKAGKF